MRDFYDDLNISRAATLADIRAAFKRLAKQYHPDRNPNNKEAEEKFKAINEAYHTLCNPVKKAQYDLKLYGLVLTYNHLHWEEVKQRRYYQWQRANENRYRFDRNYFKIQGLAFLVFLIIAGFCFAVIHTAHYYVRKQEREKYILHTQFIKQANGLFGKGKFADAFQLLHNLETEDPLEYRFGFIRDSLVDALRQQADHEFMQKDFQAAIGHYNILQQHERPIRFETLENMSMCQYYLGNFSESIQSLKHLHNQDPYNLALIYQIGIINLEKLDNPEEALQYFTLGKRRFKENLSEVYGAAFQIVMNPTDAPDIYYYIFMGRANANYKLGRYKEAATDCNWAIFLRRNQAEPHYLRAMIALNRRDKANACEDLTKASQLGMDVSKLRSKYCRSDLQSAIGQ